MQREATYGVCDLIAIFSLVIALLFLSMEEAQDADIDGIDRESLVKEIELIRQTLGGASTRALTHGEFVSYDVRDNDRDSDDSEDELGTTVKFCVFSMCIYLY